MILDILSKRLIGENPDPEYLLGFVKKFAITLGNNDDPNYDNKIRKLLIEAAKNPVTPKAALIILLDLKVQEITFPIVKKTTDSSILEYAYKVNGKSDKILPQILRNPVIDGNFLRKICLEINWNDTGANFFLHLIKEHPNCPPDVLDMAENRRENNRENSRKWIIDNNKHLHEPKKK